MANFALIESSKLISRKILKFPHCVEATYLMTGVVDGVSRLLEISTEIPESESLSIFSSFGAVDGWPAEDGSAAVEGCPFAVTAAASLLRVQGPHLHCRSTQQFKIFRSSTKWRSTLLSWFTDLTVLFQLCCEAVIKKTIHNINKSYIYSEVYLRVWRVYMRPYEPPRVI